MVFKNRVDAGRRLAARLTEFQVPQPVVLGLPRGGITVAYEVAQALSAPLDFVLARKIAVPGRPEESIGAISSGATYLNDDLISRLEIGRKYIELTIAAETQRMERQEQFFRGASTAYEVRDRTAILVDDGVATGATALASVRAVLKGSPARLIFAAPVCSLEAMKLLSREADAVACLEVPAEFSTVREWYKDFSEVTDAEVLGLLERARSRA